MNSLAGKIADLVMQNGPISFRQFMEMALYDPEQGYYSQQREIGRHGDYYTSADIHPLFGQLLTEKFVELLATLEPEPCLSLIEVGAGTGQLAEDVLTALKEHHASVLDQLTYFIAERSPSLKSVQQNRLKEFNQVRWKSLSEFEPHSVNGIVLSNELIDAFPVYRIMRKSGRWWELLVSWHEGRFVWTLGDLSSDELNRFLQEYTLPLEEGQIAEVNLTAIEYLRTVAHVLRQGFVVTIDYGEPRERLYSAARREGTLRCFYKHTVTDNPFERIGQQDITASVDFTMLIEYGRRFGLEIVEFKRQREFLMDQGLMERLVALERSETEAVSRLTSKLAAKHFLMSGALGNHFKVLIQRRSYA